MNRITALFVGAWKAVCWFFARDPEHSLIEPPEPEVGEVYFEDAHK